MRAVEIPAALHADVKSFQQRQFELAQLAGIEAQSEHAGKRVVITTHEIPAIIAARNAGYARADANVVAEFLDGGCTLRIAVRHIFRTVQNVQPICQRRCGEFHRIHANGVEQTFRRAVVARQRLQRDEFFRQQVIAVVRQPCTLRFQFPRNVTFKPGQHACLRFIRNFPTCFVRAREHECREYWIALAGIAGVVIGESRRRQIIGQRAYDDFPKCLVPGAHRARHSLLKAGKRIARKVGANAAGIRAIRARERHGHVALCRRRIRLQRERGFALYFAAGVRHRSFRQRCLQCLLDTQRIATLLSFLNCGEVPHRFFADRRSLHIPRHHCALARANALFTFWQGSAAHLRRHVSDDRALRGVAQRDASSIFIAITYDGWQTGKELQIACRANTRFTSAESFAVRIGHRNDPEACQRIVERHLDAGCAVSVSDNIALPQNQRVEQFTGACASSA